MLFELEHQSVRVCFPPKHASESEQDTNQPEVTQPARPTPDPQPAAQSSEELNVVCETTGETEYCLECLNAPLRHGTNEFNLTVQVTMWMIGVMG